MRSSSIARLMLVVLTVAVGLVTIRSQSEILLGVLIAVVGAWVPVALGALVAEESRSRPFWLAFLLALSASLVYGFGPWSDRTTRGAFPMDAATLATYDKGLLPTTRLLLRLSFEVRPSPLAEIQTYDADGNLVARIVISPRASPASELDQLMLALDRAVVEDIKFFSSFNPHYATRRVVIQNSLEIYLDAAYLLASLVMGVVAGTLIGLFFLVRRTRRGKSPRSEGINASLSPVSSPARIDVRTPKAETAAMMKGDGNRADRTTGQAPTT